MLPPPQKDGDFPYWLVVLIAIGAWLFYLALSNGLYAQVLATLSKGVGMTIFVTLVGFSMAALMGLGLAVATLSRFIVLRQLARLYIEVVRGIPIIVLLLYIAFAAAPAAVAAWNWLTGPLGIDPFSTRDVSLLWRAIIALTIAYSAFIAEVFRAGPASRRRGSDRSGEGAGTQRLAPLPLHRLPAGLPHDPAAPRAMISWRW